MISTAHIVLAGIVINITQIYLVDDHLPHPFRHTLWPVLSLGLQYLKFPLASQAELVLVHSPCKIGMDFIISKFPCHLISSTIAKILKPL